MKKQHITLQTADKLYLEKLLAKGNLAVKTFKRATALLELERGKTLKSVARTLSVSNETVARWAANYKQEGLLFLKDKARSGRPIAISGEQRAKITALACSTPPLGYHRWSLRLLADKIIELDESGPVSYGSVGNILKKTKLNLI